MHEQLLAQLKSIEGIKGINNSAMLFKLVEQKKYSEALLIACQACKFGNKRLFLFIETLLKYKTELSINPNIVSNDGNNTIFYAAVNKNNELYFLLDRLGADWHLKNKHGQNAVEVHAQEGEELSLFFASHLDPHFKAELSKLQAMYRHLPDKHSFPNDAANAQHDLERVKYIVARLNQILKYLNLQQGQLLPVTVSLTPYHKEALNYVALMFLREFLTEIHTTVHNLSGEFRGKHKHFGLPGFTWITLDQFGGIIKLKPVLGTLFSFPIKGTAKDGQMELSFQEFSKRFFQEFSNTEQILDEVLPDLVNLDLPHLKRLFEQIYLAELNKKPVTIEPVCLNVTQAITSRTMDNRSILNLLHLMNYTDKTYPVIEKDHSILHNYTICEGPKKGEEYTERFNLSRKSGRHAALRRLQRIGELFTGKNYSSELFDLDKTIDWRAFITVRDAITHQDERDLKYKIDVVLADEGLLERIMGMEMSDFWGRLHKMLELREQLTGAYNGYNIKAHWARILKHHLDKPASIPELVIPEVPLVERRVTLEEENTVIAALTSQAAPQEIIDKFRSIFDGTGPIPGKKELGSLQRYFPARNIDKAAFNKLAKIVSKATTTRSTEEERNKAREELKERAIRREMERESNFKGLDCLRMLAKELTSPADKAHMLTPLKRVAAAIEALNNIQVFLTEAGYLIPGLSFKTMQEWDAYHLYHQGVPLVSLLATNYELNDALEYNTGQLLQHLATIYEFTETHYTKYLGKEYDSLRALRNYIEHGDPLLDVPGMDDGIQSADSEFRRRQRIAPFMISLINELGKDLKMIRNSLVHGTNLHLTPLVSPKEKEKWESCCNTTSEMSPDVTADGHFGTLVSPEENTAWDKVCDTNAQVKQCSPTGYGGFFSLTPEPMATEQQSNNYSPILGS